MHMCCIKLPTRTVWPWATSFGGGHGQEEAEAFMVNGSPPDDCFLCAAQSRPADALPWFDRPLIHEASTGVALSAVGALIPGYVLVSPAAHAPSVQGLPASAHAAFLAFVQDVLRHVERAYGPATIFEHGSCHGSSRRRSACVMHSHLHVLPGRYGLDGLLDQEEVFGSLAEMLQAPAERRHEGYLMYREPGGPVHYARDVGMPQFFRRHISARLSEPDAWDYAVFPRWQNVLATQAALAGGVTAASPAAT
jgi:diadenosine tetraphosphate (Ap4A) HIT family hydrolase